MWYGSALPTYHGLQSMSVLMFLSFRTAALYDFAVTGALDVEQRLGREHRVQEAHLGERLRGDLRVLLEDRRASAGCRGPATASSRPNSWLMNILPSNCGNCSAMNVLAIGVDEPHFTLSTSPCAIGRLHERRRGVGREVEDDAAARARRLVQLLDDRVRVRDGQLDREALARDARPRWRPSARRRRRTRRSWRARRRSATSRQRGRAPARRRCSSSAGPCSTRRWRACRSTRPARRRRSRRTPWTCSTSSSSRTR